MIDSIVWLVSCGINKRDVSCKAKDMFISDTFKKLRTIAESTHLKWYILSVKYGLLHPNDVIEPYDDNLDSFSDQCKQEWRGNIKDKLCCFDKHTTFVVIAPNEYSRSIVPLLNESNFRVIAPFENFSQEYIDNYIKRAIYLSDAVKLYNNLFRVAECTGGVRLFSECSGKMYWPQRGVYFIVDFNENCMLSGSYPRIVRIGTHAVSKGSKATLWNRLKTHKGTNTGGGNHRASIFRLHVGNAIINKEDLVCDTWGIGQNANREIRANEYEIEKSVSSYIGQLGIIVLDVDDLPSKESARAIIEKNSISLLSSINFSFNFSTTNWLGNYSPRNEIVNSCLWNINYINSEYNSSFMKTFEYYANNTINNYKLAKGISHE